MNDTDKELLELAAKAAGVEWDAKSGYRKRKTGEIGVTGMPLLIKWNPLTDDGDALRLAAKLHLWKAVRLAHRKVSDTVDIYAATRRAIVRAAAEIGRNMK